MTHILAPSDSEYPKLLKEISDPPQRLYIKGHLTGPTIAVVGTRTASQYGVSVTKQIVVGLVNRGFTIVSGLAVGIDTVAHQAAIAAGGKTIAVLGCGIDKVYPPSNAKLYQQIALRFGAVVSQYPGFIWLGKEEFKRRNRIISGLSLGVVVIEGAETSGALITARFAAEQGREVFAVPGPVTSPQARGPAILIKQGAKLVEKVEDIIDEFNYR